MSDEKTPPQGGDDAAAVPDPPAPAGRNKADDVPGDGEAGSRIPDRLTGLFEELRSRLDGRWSSVHWVAMCAVVSVFAFLIAALMIHAYGFNPNLLFEKLIAIIGVFLIIGLLVQTKDAAIISLGLFVVAALIIGPSGAVQVLGAYRGDTATFEQQSLQYETVRTVVTDHGRLSELVLEQLDEFGELGDELWLTRSDPEATLAGVAARQRSANQAIIGCALDEAIEELTLQLVRGRAEYGLLRDITAAMPPGDLPGVEADPFFLIKRFQDAGEHDDEVRRELELLRALGLVEFERDNYFDATPSDDGRRLVENGESFDTLTLRDRLSAELERSGQTPTPSVYLQTSDPLVAGYQTESRDRDRGFQEQAISAAAERLVRTSGLDPRNCGHVRQLIQQTFSEEARVESLRTNRSLVATADPFGSPPRFFDRGEDDEDTPLRYVQAVPAEIAVVRSVSIGPEARWFFFSYPADYAGDRSAVNMLHVDVSSDTADPWVRVVGAFGEPLAENDDWSQAASLPVELGDLDSRAYFVHSPSDLGFWVGVRTYSSREGAGGAATIRLYMAYRQQVRP